MSRASGMLAVLSFLTECRSHGYIHVVKIHRVPHLPRVYLLV